MEAPCPDSNARYLDQWRALRQNTEQQAIIEQAMRLEPRVRSFGYSLEE